VGWYFPDTLGGTEIYVDAIVRSFQRAGIETVVAAPRAGAREHSEYMHEGTPVFRYAIPACPTRAEARGEQPARGADAFHRWLSEQQPDIVHFHTFVTGLDLAEVRAAREAGARVFVTTHSSALGYVCLRGTLMRWGQEPCDGVVRPRTCAACALHARGIPRPVSWLPAALPASAARHLDRVDHAVGTALGLPAYIERRQRRQRELFAAIDRFFVLTGRARDVLVANDAPAEKVVVNRLGVDTRVVAQRPEADRPHQGPITVGFLGRLDPVKGIDDLLNAIALLPLSAEVRFDIRGISDQAASGPILARLTAAAAADPRLSIGGVVRREDIAALLASWDVLVCPGKSLEGGPTVALEALAVGTPVIASSLGGVAELLTDGVNGILVPPADARALARALQRVADQPTLVGQWRHALPPVRTMDDVARDYLLEYAA
jgi:glycosyltransferase involved in cell wall biosynthesis